MHLIYCIPNLAKHVAKPERETNYPQVSACGAPLTALWFFSLRTVRWGPTRDAAWCSTKISHDGKKVKVKLSGLFPSTRNNPTKPHRKPSPSYLKTEPSKVLQLNLNSIEVFSNSKSRLLPDESVRTCSLVKY